MCSRQKRLFNQTVCPIEKIEPPYIILRSAGFDIVKEGQLMCFRDDFFFDDFDRQRRRERLICECREVDGRRHDRHRRRRRDIFVCRCREI